ncbi:MAG: sulfite reductase subunit alpha [Alphaproteobacteria bacterium]|nr:sulfite reductase subunit alpha [Alphaproteobacteria bacterium]
MIEALDPQARRYAAAGVVALAWLAFSGLIAARQALRRRAERRAAATLAQGSGAPVLVAFASQTGFAEQLARATAQALTTAGAPVILRPLSTVTAADLAGADQALFVVSTTGEGDAPDSARAFLRDVMGAASDLSALRHGVLALGDRDYARFAAFGRTLNAWLAAQGATPLFDRIEVDDGDPDALALWRSRLADLTGAAQAADWNRPTCGPWTLTGRRLLNPGGAGGEAWHVRLEPADGVLDWVAGDLFEVVPDGAAAARDYSIASVPSDGGVELIVRLRHGPDGKPGLGSGALCRQAAIGDTVSARVRTNRAFHAPDTDAPMILIGAGTGLAGLRAHLKARAAQGRSRNWLLFGERTAAPDDFHRDEIEGWTASGVIARLDLVFSRDQSERLYVQHRLRAAAEAVRAWVADGATILVCGSREGMSQAVDAALVDILGADGLAALTDAGRYRRDVY